MLCTKKQKGCKARDQEEPLPSTRTAKNHLPTRGQVRRYASYLYTHFVCPSLSSIPSFFSNTLYFQALLSPSVSTLPSFHLSPSSNSFLSLILFRFRFFLLSYLNSSSMLLLFLSVLLLSIGSSSSFLPFRIFILHFFNYQSVPSYILSSLLPFLLFPGSLIFPLNSPVPPLIILSLSFLLTFLLFSLSRRSSIYSRIPLLHLSYAFLIFALLPFSFHPFSHSLPPSPTLSTAGRN